MHFLEYTFPTIESNLACDEALLDAAEAGELGEVLRCWAPTTYAVVVGRSNVVDREVDRAACERAQIPVRRRCSGGGTVLQGAGCLNYALILSLERRPELESITGANSYIMQRHAELLSSLLDELVCVRGTTDLVCGDRKCSGNAQRRKRRTILFHGTFLLDLDLGKVERYLARPSRMPTYRRARTHNAFLHNLPLTGRVVVEGLRELWGAHLPLARPPHVRVQRLVQEKYSHSEWNLRSSARQPSLSGGAKAQPTSDRSRPPASGLGHAH